jgi:hypothetical protein
MFRSVNPISRAIPLMHVVSVADQRGRAGIIASSGPSNSDCSMIYEPQACCAHFSEFWSNFTAAQKNLTVAQEVPVLKMPDVGGRSLSA